MTSNQVFGLSYNIPVSDITAQRIVGFSVGLQAAL